jgi:ATP-dependent DNA ligase
MNSNTYSIYGSEQKVSRSGPGWIHEIKHDSFRILAHRDGKDVRLHTRNGYNFADSVRR